MKATLRAALVGVALAALLAGCGRPDEPLEAPGDALPPEHECVTAFSEIEQEVEAVSAAGDLLDGTLLRCDSFDEWRGTLEASEIVVDQDPATFAGTRCDEVDELAGSPVCVEAVE